MRTSSFLIGGALLLIAGTASAQADPDSVKRRNDCRLAAQVVTTGQPAPHSEWAYGLIPQCGPEGAAALASTIRSTRSANSLDLLNRVTKPTQFVADAGVFAAALEVLADRAASLQARVFAVRTLLWSLDNMLDIRYEDMVATTRSLSPCARGSITDVPSYIGTPLPADAKAQAIEAGTRVWKSEGEPAELRRAASCLGYLGLPRPEREPPGT